MDRIYSPLVTLWVFLGQVLSADHSCRAAVARLIAHRVSRGQSPCSAETGAYCQARKRLPEKFFSDVARETGRALEANVDSHWLWKRRRVYVYDGASVPMPDTPANQRDYPQPDTQKRGLGFPLARIAAVFSLACGAVLDLGICRYAGKDKASWACCAPCGICFALRMSCSPIDGGSQPAGIGVQVNHRRADALVAEEFLDLFDVGAGAQERCRKMMSHFVRREAPAGPCPRQPREAGESLHDPLDRAGADVPGARREDETAAAVPQPGPDGRRCPGRDRHGAVLFTLPLPDPGQGPRQVQLLDAEPSDLGDPQAEVEAEGDDAPVAVVGGSGNERCGLLVGQKCGKWAGHMGLGQA